jgi:AraC-like DNA-binding protein
LLTGSAKRLLAAGHVSVTELAQIVGLGDVSRFDKVFKRHTGFTPSSYRSLALTWSNKEQRLGKKLLATVEQVP